MVSGYPNSAWMNLPGKEREGLRDLSPPPGSPGENSLVLECLPDDFHMDSAFVSFRTFFFSGVYLAAYGIRST